MAENPNIYREMYAIDRGSTRADSTGSSPARRPPIYTPRRRASDKQERVIKHATQRTNALYTKETGGIDRGEYNAGSAGQQTGGDRRRWRRGLCGHEQRVARDGGILACGSRRRLWERPRGHQPCAASWWVAGGCARARLHFVTRQPCLCGAALRARPLMTGQGGDGRTDGRYGRTGSWCGVAYRDKGGGRGRNSRGRLRARLNAHESRDGCKIK